MSSRLLGLVAVITFMTACTRRNPEVCCETVAECAVVGTSELVACETGVCVANACVDEGRCDGDEDCNEPDHCADGVCKSAPLVDAARVAAFDIAYPKEWRFSVFDEVSEFSVFINKGTSPLSMSSLELKSITDDHPTVLVRLVAHPSPAAIPPGLAGGQLTPIAKAVLVDSAIVTEARSNETTSYLSLQLVDAPDGTYDIAVDAVLALDGLDVPMQMLVHVVPGPTIYADPELGTRTSILR